MHSSIKKHWPPLICSGAAAELEEEMDAREASRAEEQRQRQKWKGEQKELLDEMLPKSTGR